jgi:hypothetical protein
MLPDRGAAMFSQHAHNLVSTLCRVRNLVGVRLPAFGRKYETLEAETIRRRKPYLDLKRIKTVAPDWRCAAVSYLDYCLPNFGELDPIDDPKKLLSEASGDLRWMPRGM